MRTIYLKTFEIYCVHGIGIVVQYFPSQLWDIMAGRGVKITSQQTN